jgi:hypothetical protein
MILWSPSEPNEFVGNWFLAISAGTARAPVAAAGATLAGAEPTDISALLDQAKGTIQDIDTTVRNANHLVTNAKRVNHNTRGQSQFNCDRGKDYGVQREGPDRRP